MREIFRILGLVMLLVLTGNLLGQNQLVENGKFSDGGAGWTIATSPALNYWRVGDIPTHVFFEPTNQPEDTETAAYITNNGSVYGGTGWGYSINSGSRSLIYQTIEFPIDAVDISLSFNWAGWGQLFCDYLKVYLYPADTEIFAQSNVMGPDPGVEQYQVGGPYQMTNGWQTANINLPSTVYAGETRILAFAWRNDNFDGAGHPAAITNVSITHDTFVGIPPNVTLIAPANNSTYIPIQPTLTWTRNEGGIPDNYTIYLGTDTNPAQNIGTVDGETKIVDFPISQWQIDVALENNTRYYWKVVPSNEFGSPEDAVIFSFITTNNAIVQIGNPLGDDTNIVQKYVPLYPYIRYAYNQSIFYPSEINRPDGETITHISWYFNGAAAFTDVLNIWMGYTDRNTFASITGWIPNNTLIPVVVEKTVSFPATAGWVEIELDEPFVYDSSAGNLVINVADISSNTSSMNNLFYTMNTPSANRTLGHYRDNPGPYNPDNLSGINGTLRALVPLTRLTFLPIVEGAFLHCNTSVLDFGEIAKNADSSQTVNFRNRGIENMILNVTLPPYLSMDNENPIVVDPNGSLDITFTLNLSYETEYDENINISSNAVNLPEKNIRVSATSATFFVFGTGNNTTSTIPWHANQRISYSQSIYTQDDLADLELGVTIYRIAYEYNGIANASRHIRLYMGWTTETDFPDPNSWLPISDMELVYQGAQTLAANPGWYPLNMLSSNGFYYYPPSPEHNLVVACEVYQEPSSISSSSCSFYTTETGSNRSLVIYRSSEPFDLDDIPTSGNIFLRNTVPNIKFYYVEFSLPRVQNLIAIPGFNKVSLLWSQPVLPPYLTFSGYSIYKNDLEIVSGLMQTEYIDIEVINGIRYQYFIVANYGVDGSSYPSLAIEITPTGSVLDPPANMRAVTDESSVTLNWNLGQTLLNENFEMPTLHDSWLSLDNDGDGFGWEIVSYGGKEGIQYIVSNSRDDDLHILYPENWLISPEFILNSEDTYLNYWIGAVSGAYQQEKYQVLMSTTGTEIVDFSLELLEETLEIATWQRRSINLPYSTEPVRIAFVHIVDCDSELNRSGLKLDAISIVEPNTELDFVYEPIAYNVYKDGELVKTINQLSQRNYTENNLPNGEYLYWVTTLYSPEGTQIESTPSNVVKIVIDVSTSEDDHSTPTIKTTLRGNYPNPFNPSTSIRFTVSDEHSNQHVSISIYNIRGQKVRNLVNDEFSPGEHSVVWNGTDETGKNVSSGVYFYRMSAKGYTATEKMILVK
jgi:flagellar hook assembly protein FlgD